MKVLHLCLACFFPDNYSYQENMLPKFHKQLGYETEVIASLKNFDKNGLPSNYEKAITYSNEYDIKVTRLDYRKPLKLFKKLRKYRGFKKALADAAPDIIFIHGCQFMDIAIVAEYVKKHRDVKVFVDNHADFINSASNFVSKKILHGIIWKWCAKKIEPYTEKFYGVLPARVDFLRDIYGLPKEKTELLVMGADDEKVENADREKMREKLGLGDKFTVITGGKIDHNKPETLKLMRAVVNSDSDNVKLVVFGSVIPELKEEFDTLVKSDKILYIGWIKSEDIYDYFVASDLAFFPGKHSVLWEQAVGSGLPCVFRKMKGFDHVDINGNCVFIEDLSEKALAECLFDIVQNTEKYSKMKIAAEKGLVTFSYKEIAAKSIL